MLHVEVFEYMLGAPVAVIFCYENRDPITKNGSVRYVTMEEKNAGLRDNCPPIV